MLHALVFAFNLNASTQLTEPPPYDQVAQAQADLAAYVKAHPEDSKALQTWHWVLTAEVATWSFQSIEVLSYAGLTEACTNKSHDHIREIVIGELQHLTEWFKLLDDDLTSSLSSLESPVAQEATVRARAGLRSAMSLAKTLEQASPR